MPEPVLTVPSRPVSSAVPGALIAAALITIFAAAGFGLLVLIVAAGVVIVGPVLVEDFRHTDGDVLLVLGLFATLLATCAVAVVAAMSLLLRHRWAWWTLLVLSSVTVVLGLVVGPFGLWEASAAAAAVLVLLLLPSSRAWIASSP